MTQPGIEPMSPGPLPNTLTIMQVYFTKIIFWNIRITISFFEHKNQIELKKMKAFQTKFYTLRNLRMTNSSFENKG